ncbi:MAG: hypothetical protein ACQESR_08320, partial [Planctomycetota bacterium]
MDPRFETLHQDIVPKRSKKSHPGATGIAWVLNRITDIYVPNFLGGNPGYCRAFSVVTGYHRIVSAAGVAA